MDELDAIAEEEEKDIRDRDALSKRIREREKRNTRHIVSKSEARAQAEAAKRLKLSTSTSSGNQKELMKKLREESRRAYLPKRKEDKLYELRRQLGEDEAYFPDEELTERERIDRETKRRVLKAAEEYDNAGNLLTAQRYHIPDANRALLETLVDEPTAPGGDGRRWEDDRLHTAIFQTGAKDAKVCCIKTFDFNTLHFRNPMIWICCWRRMNESTLSRLSA
jgi:pre-mRNA-splicing factor ATP-dependent RNA helicase DHX16